MKRWTSSQKGASRTAPAPVQEEAHSPNQCRRSSGGGGNSRLSRKVNENRLLQSRSPAARARAAEVAILPLSPRSRPSGLAVARPRHHVPRTRARCQLGDLPGDVIVIARLESFDLRSILAPYLALPSHTELAGRVALAVEPSRLDEKATVAEHRVENQLHNFLAIPGMGLNELYAEPLHTIRVLGSHRRQRECVRACRLGKEPLDCRVASPPRRLGLGDGLSHLLGRGPPTGRP